MACPFFRPERPLDGARVARAPLGSLYAGTCEAGAPQCDPELCNFGYAKGRCGAFPESAAFDAVRFSVYRDTDVDPLEVVWVHEKAYTPVEHGLLHYSRSRHGFLETTDDPLLERQAAAFVARWVRA